MRKIIFLVFILLLSLEHIGHCQKVDGPDVEEPTSIPASLLEYTYIESALVAWHEGQDKMLVVSKAKYLNAGNVPVQQYDFFAVTAADEHLLDTATLTSLDIVAGELFGFTHIDRRESYLCSL